MHIPLNPIRRVYEKDDMANFRYVYSSVLFFTQLFTTVNKAILAAFDVLEDNSVGRKLSEKKKNIWSIGEASRVTVKFLEQSLGQTCCDNHSVIAVEINVR